MGHIGIFPPEMRNGVWHGAIAPFFPKRIQRAIISGAQGMTNGALDRAKRHFAESQCACMLFSQIKKLMSDPRPAIGVQQNGFSTIENLRQIQNQSSKSGLKFISMIAHWCPRCGTNQFKTVKRANQNCGEIIAIGA